jgi:hypothetical protein
MLLKSTAVIIVAFKSTPTKLLIALFKTEFDTVIGYASEFRLKLDGLYKIESWSSKRDVNKLFTVSNMNVVIVLFDI